MYSTTLPQTARREVNALGNTKNDLRKSTVTPGSSFGKLTVLDDYCVHQCETVWRCQCRCGTIIKVLESNLTDHSVRDCGCESRRKRSREDLAGQRFGRLVAVRYEFDDKRHQPCWTFHCDCGTEKILSVNQVKWSGVQSCGCLRKERTGNLNKKDISGKRFGRLIAIRQTEYRDSPGTTVWECQCDCGNSAFYSLNELNSGKAKSCGCLYRESRKDCSKNRADLVDETSLSSLLAAKKIRSNNTSGITGVHFDPKLGKWVAYISYKKKRYYLGLYINKDDAVKARKYAEKELHDSMIEEHWSELSGLWRTEYLIYLKSTSSNYPQTLGKQC